MIPFKKTIFFLLISIVLISMIRFQVHLNDQKGLVQPTKQTIRGQVTKVIDGDTIEVKFLNEKKEKVRFLLIDSPETVGKQQPFGQEAKLYITELLLHKEVELQIGLKERDKYGRLLAYIFIENRNIQELLLSKGLARVAYVYDPNTEFVEEYCKMERIAQEKKIGIWSTEYYITECR